MSAPLRDRYTVTYTHVAPVVRGVLTDVREHRWRAWLRTVALRVLTWVAGRIEGER